MTKKTIGKIFVTFVILTLVFSFAACTDEGAVDEPEETDPDEDLLEEEVLPGTLAIPIHPDLELVYSSEDSESEEEGLYAYSSDKKLETMYDFYNNMTTFTASPNFTTTTDIFMVKTELYDVIQEMGGFIEDNENIEQWEDELTETYEASEGVVTVIGVRGGTEEFEGVLPDQMQEYVPDEGCLLYFSRLIESPVTE